MSATPLTEGEKAMVTAAFDDNPEASGDWVITRKEWRQLFGAVEKILADHDQRARAEALEQAADHLPVTRCRCFREEDHDAPSGCLMVDTWLRDRAASIGSGETR